MTWWENAERRRARDAADPEMLPVGPDRTGRCTVCGRPVQQEGGAWSHMNPHHPDTWGHPADPA